MNNTELINILKQNGWELFASNKVYHYYKHPIKSEIIKISHIKQFTLGDSLNTILQQIGIDKKKLC